MLLLVDCNEHNSSISKCTKLKVRMDTVKNDLGFEVVPRKETTRRFLAFQDSFRGFLDGSEFMPTKCPPAPDSLDFLSSVVGREDEAQKIEAAMCNARKMARECSLQTIGSYQPYDVADPNTWSKKVKKKKRRESAGCLSAPARRRPTQEEEFCTESSEMVVAPTHQTNRRASAPTSSLHVRDQEPNTERSKEDGRKIKDIRRSGRKSGHRSHSPSRNASGKKEKRSRRVPIAKGGTILDKEVYDTPQDNQSEGNSISMNQASASSIASSSWWSEDTPYIGIGGLNLRHEEWFPETRKGREGELYCSDQSMSIFSKTSKEREFHSSQSSSMESSAMLHLEFKEKMLQERLLETARRLSALNMEERFLPHDTKTAPTSITGLCYHTTTLEPAGLDSKAERRRSKLQHLAPAAEAGADALKVRTSG